MSGAGVIEEQQVRDPRVGGGGAARVIVLNDDHNTFQGVAMALADVIPGIDVQRGLSLATNIHERGRAIVWSGEFEVAELYWEQLRSRGLTMAPIER